MIATPKCSSDTPTPAAIDHAGLMGLLAGADKHSLEPLPFAVIGVDRDRLIRVFNRAAIMLTGLPRLRVIGQPVAGRIVPWLDGQMVADRFADAIERCRDLDESLDLIRYRGDRAVLMRVRLLARPGMAMRFVVIGSC